MASKILDRHYIDTELLGLNETVASTHNKCLTKKELVEWDKNGDYGFSFVIENPYQETNKLLSEDEALLPDPICEIQNPFNSNIGLPADTELIINGFNIFNRGTQSINLYTNREGCVGQVEDTSELIKIKKPGFYMYKSFRITDWELVATTQYERSYRCVFYYDIRDGRMHARGTYEVNRNEML